jgi:hypothetical protein
MRDKIVLVKILVYNNPKPLKFCLPLKKKLMKKPIFKLSVEQDKSEKIVCFEKDIVISTRHLLVNVTTSQV